MFNNYIKIALRNLWRYKNYSFINILGLTIGLSSFFLTLIFVQDELSFDGIHNKSEQIYRVTERIKQADQDARWIGVTAPPLANAIQENFPEVEDYVNLTNPGQLSHQLGERFFNERNWLMASEQFFKVFDFKLLQGDPALALKEPNSILLSQEKAKVYFGEENPMGKVIESGRFGEVKVTGVFEDIPQNSHLQFDMLISYNSLYTHAGGRGEYYSRLKNDWNEFLPKTYFLFKEGTDVNALEPKIQEYVSVQQEDNPEITRALELQALKDIHFQSADLEFALDKGTRGNKVLLNAFILICLLILSIAIINYVNLTTAKSVYRAKEIGLRKVVGASRKQLIIQFLSESIILSLFAFGISYALSELLLPYYNMLSGKAFQTTHLTQVLPFMLLIAIFVGILAGTYPALIISGFKPIQIIRGNITSSVQNNKKGVLLRQGLVVTQFALSMLMIITTLLVTKQLYYIQNKDIGFDQSQLMIIDINSGNARRNFRTFKNEFAQIPGVQNVAVSTRVPGEWKNITEWEIKKKESGESSPLRSYYFGFDQHTLKTFKIEVIKGKGFSGDDLRDSTKILINEAAVKALGWENPIGKHILSADTSNAFEAEIIGVVKDFHYQSLHEKIAPLTIGYWNSPIRVIDYYALRLSSANLPATTEKIKEVYDKIDPETPIEYHFLDEQISLFYQKEHFTRQILFLGACLSILIACMGLFGLTAFMLQKKTKEVAIRKVLGASISGLLILLSREFMIQVGLAMLIATPIAWYFMQGWLQNFAYHISLLSNWYLFVLTGLIAVIIALLTISQQAYRTATVNPADVLKDE